MQVVTKIYGRSDSKSADMQCVFDVRSIFDNGSWTYKMSNTKFTFFNEPIDELNNNSIQIRTMVKIEEILNSDKAMDFICSPILRVYYDDELKLPVVKFK